MKIKRIYMDNAAATPMDKRVEKVMRPFWSKEFGNPSALYKEGVSAKDAVSRARKSIAESLGLSVRRTQTGVHSDEIFFTGSGTESNNLAILGILRCPMSKLGVFETPSSKLEKPHIVTSVIEHPAVLEVCKVLERDGVIDVTYVGVNNKGFVDPKEVKKSLKENTILVSIMYANNEIGTVQPVREIAKIIRAWKNQNNSEYPYFHTDACQAMNYLDMNVLRLGVDLLTINGSKIYGPKGIGVLYVKKRVNIWPVVLGGGQERGLRSGTENVPVVVGFAEAVKITDDIKEKEILRLTELRNYFIKGLLSKIPGSILNGDEINRLPNNINISIPNIDSEQLVIELDAKGVAVSARSACKSRDYQSSYVIMAIGREPLPNEGGVRFSLGRETTKKDIDYVLKILPEIIQKIQL
jgi:cysteine desulfurase